MPKHIPSLTWYLIICTMLSHAQLMIGVLRPMHGTLAWRSGYWTQSLSVMLFQQPQGNAGHVQQILGSRGIAFESSAAICLDW